MSFIQIQALGNVGRDPELQVTSDGTPVTKFSLAVNKRRKDKEETIWLNCSAWRGLAETIERYVHQGDQLFIQGDLTPRPYTTKDGKPGFSLDITVDKFAFAGSKSQNGSTAGASDPFLPDDL